MRHFHSTAVAQISHFAHSHGEKQNQDFVFHCKYLHRQFLSWQTQLPTLITDQKKNLPDICPLPFHSQTVYISWMMIFILCIFDAEFIEAHPVFAAKARMEKWKLKKKCTRTHTQKTNKKRWTFEFQHAPWTSHGATLMENALELFTLQTRHVQAFGTMAGRHCGETFR